MRSSVTTKSPSPDSIFSRRRAGELGPEVRDHGEDPAVVVVSAMVDLHEDVAGVLADRLLRDNELGIGLSVEILLDTTLVRLVLLSAVLLIFRRPDGVHPRRETAEVDPVGGLWAR